MVVSWQSTNNAHFSLIETNLNMLVWGVMTNGPGRASMSKIPLSPPLLAVSGNSIDRRGASTILTRTSAPWVGQHQMIFISSEEEILTGLDIQCFSPDFVLIAILSLDNPPFAIQFLHQMWISDSVIITAKTYSYRRLLLGISVIGSALNHGSSLLIFSKPTIPRDIFPALFSWSLSLVLHRFTHARTLLQS